MANPLVRDEIAKIMGFWVQLGLSGFRVDAVPFFLETMGVPDGEQALPDPHEYLRDLRSMLNRRVGDAILLGEVNLSHKDQLLFFGGPEGDELHMQFDFIGMQRIYLSLARSDSAPLVDALQKRPQPQPESQWASFVRNHDELTLDKLSEAERQEVFAAFGPGAGDAGLRPRPDPPAASDARRRPAPDQDGLQPAVLPAGHAGAVLRRGDRDGREPGRRRPAGRAYADAVVERASNGGFSNAPADRLPGQLPEGAYGPEFVNVTDQERDPDSLLNFIRTLATTYRNCPGARLGTLEVLEQPHAAVLAHRTTWDDGSIVTLHNSAAEPVTVPFTLDGLEPGTTLVDLLDRRLGRARRRRAGGAGARGVRLPLAAGHSSGFPPPPASPPGTPARNCRQIAGVRDGIPAV